jgi:predicted RNase H-like nuclease (RuvC/YqgF family)
MSDNSLPDANEQNHEVDLDGQETKAETQPASTQNIDPQIKKLRREAGNYRTERNELRNQVDDFQNQLKEMTALKETVSAIQAQLDNERKARQKAELKAKQLPDDVVDELIGLGNPEQISKLADLFAKQIKPPQTPAVNLGHGLPAQDDNANAKAILQKMLGGGGKPLGG